MSAIHRAYWTDDEVARLRTLWSAGYTSTLIAEMMGRTRASIMGRVTRHGLVRDTFAKRRGAA